MVAVMGGVGVQVSVTPAITAAWWTPSHTDTCLSAHSVTLARDAPCRDVTPNQPQELFTKKPKNSSLCAWCLLEYNLLEVIKCNVPNDLYICKQQSIMFLLPLRTVHPRWIAINVTSERICNSSAISIGLKLSEPHRRQMASLVCSVH